MRKSLTYLLLILFSIQSFEAVLITLNFKLNQDFFAEICTNKDKPELQCNGKCHLKEQIKEYEEEKSEKEKLLNEKELQIFIQHLSRCSLKPYISISEKLPAFSKHLYSLLKVYDIFHPPRS